MIKFFAAKAGLDQIIDQCEIYDLFGRVKDYSGNGNAEYGSECEFEPGIILSTGWGDGQTRLFSYGDTCGSGSGEGFYRNGDGFGSSFDFDGDGKSPK